MAGEGLAVFSTVAHELRGPLMALATSAELLVADFDALASGQIREMVVGIHCRALWLQELVENLLCAAGLREGRLTMHVQPLNLIEVVAEVRQVVSPLLRRRGQRLRIMDSAPAGPARGARRRPAPGAGAGQPDPQRQQVQPPRALHRRHPQRPRSVPPRDRRRPRPGRPGGSWRSASSSPSSGPPRSR